MYEEILVVGIHQCRDNEINILCGFLLIRKASAMRWEDLMMSSWMSRLTMTVSIVFTLRTLYLRVFCTSNTYIPPSGTIALKSVLYSAS